MGRPLTDSELQRLEFLHGERIQNWLDAGHGCCCLRGPAVAEMLAGALRHFDGQRYELLAWCIMPNHVHTVLRPLPPYELSAILGSWKGYSGNRANQILGRSGPFWQAEPYDHLVRNKTDLARQIRYVLENPVKAGLKDWKWVGKK